MSSEVTQGRGEPVVQFSIFADNKVGRLNEFVQLLAQHRLHVVALSSLDNTECSIIRVIVDYPDDARLLFHERGLQFCEDAILAVEVETEAGIPQITSFLTAAEVNIHYVYAFLTRPQGRCALAFSLEDAEFAADVLSARGIKVLSQSDIAR